MPHPESIENVTVRDLKPGDVLPGRTRPVTVERVYDGIVNGQDSLVIIYTNGERDTGLNPRTRVRRFVI